MKKFIISLCLITSYLGYSQSTGVAVSYGTASLYGAADGLLTAIGNEFTGSDYNPDSKGVLQLEVTRFNKDRRLRYGIESNIEFFGTSAQTRSKIYYGFSPKIDYFWSSSNRKLRFYSGISAGIGIRDVKYIDADDKRDSSSDAFFAFNVTPVAIRYGNEWGVFLEPNIGKRGFLQLGVSYEF